MSLCLHFTLLTHYQTKGYKKSGLRYQGGRILVDIKGGFLRTLFKDSHGHFCPLKFLLLVEFLWTFFGQILVNIFIEFSLTLFTKHVFPNLTLT